MRRMLYALFMALLTLGVGFVGLCLIALIFVGLAQ